MPDTGTTANFSADLAVDAYLGGDFAVDFAMDFSVDSAGAPGGAADSSIMAVMEVFPLLEKRIVVIRGEFGRAEMARGRRPGKTCARGTKPDRSA
jgi:hypothetical protein